MPEAAKNYSITELEMYGLAINITSFTHLLKRVDFDIVLDRLAITHIMRSKMEPATNRIKRLLEILSPYSFNLYYIKGKDMILSEFLSRQLGDDSDPHQIIPISFNIKEILKENYQNMVKDTYMVQTRSQAKAKAANTPAVQSTTRKPVTQDTIPKSDKILVKTDKDSKPNINTQTQSLQSTVVSQQLPQGLVIPLGNIIPISTHPSVRPPQKPLNTVDKGATSSPNLGQDPNVDFEENSPHQEGIITETYITQDQSYIEQPQELTNLVNTSKLVQKYLPRQADIDKILDIIKRKDTKRYSLASYHQGDTGRLLIQPIFQGFVQILGSKHIAT